MGALCLGAAISGCGSGGGAGGAQALTIYNGQHEQTTAALVKAFEAKTGIKAAVRSDDEAVLANQIIQEGSKSPADVFYTENTPPLEALREHGLLAAAAPAALSSIPARYNSAQGVWVGVSGRVSVLVYNTSELKQSQLPNSILELADPRFKGKLAFAPSETDFQPLITSIVKFRGRAAAEAWLKGLKENGRQLPDNETITSEVNSGQSALGPINHYYWYRLRREEGGHMSSALHYYAPKDPGYLVNVSGAAVLKSSRHQAAAQRFLEFLVSREGQEVLAHSDSYEYPLRPGVAAPEGLRPFSELQPASLTPAELGDGSEALALEQKVGLL
ncbi:MAG TPA: extracellular solute-binding protein [Solirubrobacteraceae bacterium]|nr:extracellular solute-binding protein [Solirubrobacteraceae bacterium]